MIFSQIGGLTRLDERPFRKESDQRGLIEPSLQKIFPCIIPLKKEFRIGRQGQNQPGKGKAYKFDMLAFDTERNCFVVIEYKNNIGSHLIEQVWKYRSIMSEPSTDMIDEYLKATGKAKLAGSVDWNRTYIITIAGGYTESQLGSADGALKDNPEILKMYTINRFGNDTVVFSQIRGTPVCKMHRRKGPRPKPPGETGLYEKFNSMVESGSMPGITCQEMKHYIKYHLDGKTLWTVRRQKRRLILQYAVKTTDNILSEDGFVKRDKNSGKYGAKDYMSYLHDSGDIKRAMPHLEKTYNRLNVASSRGVPPTHMPDESIHGKNLLRMFNLEMEKMCSRIIIKKTLHYVTYRIVEMTICVVRPSRKRLKIYYGADKKDSILSEDGFVMHSKWGRVRGAKDYESVLEDPEDVMSAMGEIKKIYSLILTKM